MKIKIDSIYVKAGINIHHGDIVYLKNEGISKNIIDPFTQKEKTVYQFNLQLADGEIKIYTMNISTQKLLISKWGDESKNWVDKPLKVLIDEKLFNGKVVNPVNLIPVKQEEVEKSKTSVKQDDDLDIPIVEEENY